MACITLQISRSGVRVPSGVPKTGHPVRGGLFLYVSGKIDKAPALQNRPANGSCPQKLYPNFRKIQKKWVMKQDFLATIHGIP